MGKFLLVENFLDQRKIFAGKKRFFDRGKKGLNLLKMKLIDKANTSVKTMKIYISRSGAKT